MDAKVSGTGSAAKSAAVGAVVKAIFAPQPCSGPTDRIGPADDRSTPPIRVRWPI